MYLSTIRYSNLGGTRKEFLMPIGLGLRAVSADKRAHMPLK